MTAEGFVPGRKVRPPGTQAPIDETAPKRNGASPKTTPRASTSKSTRSLETQIGATLVVINMMVASVPRLNADALDATEIQALAKSIDLQCKTSPRFRKYVEAALSAGSGAGLLGVCIMIGARRAARHEIIPREFDNAFGSLLAGTLAAKPITVET
jgi:hypothetical protein